MTITLTSDMEEALVERAQQQGTTPENLAVEMLQQLLRPSPASADKTKRQAALAAIQSGRYARPRVSGEGLASDAFAARKEQEKEREERRWQI